MAKLKTKNQVSNNLLMAVFIVGFSIIGILVLLKSDAAPGKTGTIEGPVGSAVFGSNITFTASWSKTVKEPRLYVSCLNQAGEVIWGQLDTWDRSSRSSLSGSKTVPVGGGSSPWHKDPTQDGVCTAELKDYVGAPFTKEIVDIAQVSFSAQGTN